MEPSFRQNRIIREQGRPKAGTNPLTAYAGEAHSKTIRVLVNEAVRRGLSLERLAALSGRDPRSLAKTILARNPRLATVTELAQALGFAPVVARALLQTHDERDELDESDERNLRRSMLRAIFNRRAIFKSGLAVENGLVAALDAAPPERRRAALGAFAIAKAGLGGKSELFALADELGFNLTAFIADETRLQEHKAEMLGARDWALELLKASPLSAEHRAKITEAFASFVEPSEFAPRQALAAAVAEYRRRLKEPAPPDTLAGILTGFTPTEEGQKV